MRRDELDRAVGWVAAFGAAALVVGAAGAAAQPSCPAGFTSQTFSFTGAEQQFVVPANASTVTIHAWGAQGAAATGSAAGVGGLGGYATGSLAVTAGQTLYIYVGGQGNTFNGAGTGGTIGGGIGGGASDVRAGGNALANRVLTAGGGGGGGQNGCQADGLAFPAGGAGGGGGGLPGGNGATSPSGGGGFGGTLGVGGAAGVGCGGFLGQPGTVPNGGNGQACCCTNGQSGGGGGGGGFVQGGGGGAGSAGTTGCGGNDKGGGGGGAGGSSDTSGVTGGSTQNDVRPGNGEVIVCYQSLSPATLTGTKSVAGSFTPGGAVTYTVVLSNSAATAQLDNPGDEFTDVLPTGLVLVSASATSGTALATVATNTVTWNGSIPGGGSVTITIHATIGFGSAGLVLSNQGSISYDANGDGTNEATALTDDPGRPGGQDPTALVVGDAAIPSLSFRGLALLAVLIGVAALLAIRKIV
ncbi:MAG: hypothetical protein U0529_22400 [Thermoanaerobaculia bacterium]